jgi:lysophospholipase L1-like esterase
MDSFKYTNQIIQAEINQNQPCWRYIDVFSQMIGQDGKPKSEYYTGDGLHLSSLGYEQWTAIVKQQLSGNINC